MAAETGGRLEGSSFEIVIRPLRAEDVEAVYEIRRQPSVVDLICES